MTHKGLIIKVELEHLIVMTDEQTYYKIQNKANSMIGQKIYFTDEDLITDHFKMQNVFLMKRKFIAVAASLLFIISLGGIWGYNLMDGLPDNDINMVFESTETIESTETTDNMALSTTESSASASKNSANAFTVATIMTIDINPSVKLSLNALDYVVAVKATNIDAKSLDFDGIIGMKAEDAVEKIVDLAKAAGFINLDDMSEDYVLITTISMNDTSLENQTPEETTNDIAKLDGLKGKIEAKILKSDSLQEVNIAIIKATKIEMREAEEKHIPIGLYVANGKQNSENKGNIDNEKITVKEYFSNNEKVKAFENKGIIVNQKLESKLKIANRILDKLDKRNFDTTAFREALLKQDTDIDAVVKEIKAIWGAIAGEPEGETIEQTEINSESNKPNENPNDSDGDSTGQPSDKPSEKPSGDDAPGNSGNSSGNSSGKKK